MKNKSQLYFINNIPATLLEHLLPPAIAASTCPYGLISSTQKNQKADPIITIHFTDKETKTQENQVNCLK